MTVYGVAVLGVLGNNKIYSVLGKRRVLKNDKTCSVLGKRHDFRKIQNAPVRARTLSGLRNIFSSTFSRKK